MPYNPTTPTLVLCDRLAAALAQDWQPESPSGVEWDFFKRFGDSGGELGTRLNGRRVVIFPTDYDNGPVTRGEDGFTHNVSVLTVERYREAGDPPRDWVSERVDFVYDRIVQGFDFGRERPSWNPKLTTLSADVQVCDVEKLVTGGKLFYSLVELVFEETRGA